MKGVIFLKKSLIFFLLKKYFLLFKFLEYRQNVCHENAIMELQTNT